jgi:flavodoxin/NAD-dependent dihydropyrimidine dehydrogenase PreA subunit
MRTVIFYFTGTGNCLKVARDLAAELGEAEVVSIARAISEKKALTADCIGIIYPVYMFGMPLIIKRFIDQLAADKNNYIFAVATYGGLAGAALAQTAGQLKRRGLKLSAGFCVRMPGNYTPLYGAIPREKQDQLFEKEKQKIKEISVAVKDKKNKITGRGFFLVNMFFSGLLYNLCSSKIPFMDKDFWADEKCTRCGICAKVCPVNNIKLVDGKPSWLHKCEQCLACLHWCPVEAIQYAKATAGRKRYRHPQIKLEDMYSGRAL